MPLLSLSRPVKSSLLGSGDTLFRQALSVGFSECSCGAINRKLQLPFADGNFTFDPL
jgi:hypothetical protein